MKIAVDVDGVIYDLLPEWLFRYNYRCNDALTPDQITEYDIMKFIKPGCKQIMRDILHHSELYTRVTLVPGAVQGIKALREAGLEVIFVTAGINPGKIWRLAKDEFLRTPEDPNLSGDWIVTSRKELLGGIDFLLDDYWLNCRQWPTQAIQFGNWAYSAHNQHHTWAGAWEEAVQLILYMKGLTE